MRRKDVQRHVPPVAPFLWVVLEHRHQFHGRNAQLQEIRNLFDKPRVGAARLRADARTGMPGELSDMEFVDDRVALVAGSHSSLPVEVRTARAGMEIAQESRPGVRARPDGRLPIERGRYEDRRRIRVEQDLLGIEVVPFELTRGRRAVDRVRIVRGARRGALRQAAVPDAPGFVVEWIELTLEQRRPELRRAVQEQRDARRESRVQREVVRVLVTDPRDTEREWQSARGRPPHVDFIPHHQRVGRGGSAVRRLSIFMKCV